MTTTKKRRRPSTQDVTLTNKTLTITNNTDSDILVIDATAVDGQEGKQIYEQSLKILETTGGKNLIKTKTQGIIVTGDSFTQDADSIILATIDTLFPVAFFDVSLDSESQNYSPVTVTNADAAKMKLAEKFYKAITAFPTSDLALDYTTALTSDDAAKVAAFFAAQDDYKGLTLNMVLAVQTYYKQYPFGWADFKAKKTYSLYTSDGTKNKSLGYVTLVNKVTTPVSIDKSVPGFTATFKNDNETKTLQYSNGQFVDDVNSASPAICLQGLFIIKSQFTKDAKDNTLISILSGTVNGSSVMALETNEDKEGNDKWYDTESLLHPDTLKERLILAGLILGGLIVLGILGATAKYFIDASRKKQPVEPMDRASLNQKLKADMQKIYDKLGNIERLPNDMINNWNDIKKQTGALLLKESKQTMLDINKRQGEYLNKLLEISDSNDIQNAIEYSGDLYDSIFYTNSENIGKSYESLMKRLKTSSENIDTLRTKYKNKIKTEDKKKLDDSKEVIDKVTRDAEQNEKTRREIEENKIPEFEE